MRPMSTRRALPAIAALGLAAACNEPSQPATRAKTEAAPAPPKPSAGGDRLPVVELVAKLHRGAFASKPDPKLGRVLCVVTVHEASLRRGEVYPVVLFASGSVATWRQTKNGSEEHFFAKLSAEEQAQAARLIDAIGGGRAMALGAFDASAVVMGVSTRVGERVETLYFESDRIPAALGRLVGLLKQRLEATNRAPSADSAR